MQAPAAPPVIRARFQSNALWEKHKALIISYGLILVILAIGWLRHPTFISAGNIRQQLVLSAFLGIIAAGQTLLILTGGIDLSVAWNLNFAAIVLTKMAGNQNSFRSVTIAIVAALGAATFFGVINGLGVAYLRIPPLVMTLGMNTVLLGATTYYTKGTPQGTAPKVIITLATKRIAGIPWALILWALVTVAMVFVLRRTTLGANIYAIGNNSKAAYLAGVPVQRTLVILYAIAGLFAGIGALLLTGYSNQSYFRMGDPYVLTSIAAVVVGGTSILGGKGGYIGTIAGAIIITLLTNLLSVENRPRADQQILFGVIVLIMLLIYGRERKARQ